MIQLGDFRLHVIKESSFKLDGGAMYGVVPKTLWQKQDPADELNRVTLHCNLLLVETPRARVLVDTGMGPRWSDKEKERYELKLLIDHKKALESVGLSNDDVDAVIISHLHFDHSGGAVIDLNGKLLPTFPRAKYYVQRGEWEFAQRANARAKGSYRADDYRPLQDQGFLVLLDGDAEIAPGISVKVTGGHTTHHQIVILESQGQHAVYFADIVPTKVHLPAPWVMGYDHFPLASCEAKSEWLSRAARENWLVVFDHEAGTPWGYLKEPSEGKYQWEPVSELSCAHNSTIAGV